MTTLETQRLILRGWQESDVNDLHDIMKKSSVIMGGWEPHANINVTLDVLNEYIENDDGWAVVLKDSKKVIGCVRVCPDHNRGKLYAKSINYVLSEDYWGNGYMSEAIKQIIKYLFDVLNIDLLSAFHIPDNIRSKNVLEKCGFEYEITIEQGYKRFDGEFFDSVCYSILKSDYIEKKLQDK